MRQAIAIKVIPPTNTLSTRLKASCERGSVTIAHSTQQSYEQSAEYALKTLIERFLSEDRKKYGTVEEGNPWRGPWSIGGTKEGWVAVQHERHCYTRIDRVGGAWL